MIEIVGWIGTFFLAICALPLALGCYFNPRKVPVDSVFLLLWTIGEVCYFIYNQVALNGNLILSINYLFNLFCIMIIWAYRASPRDFTKE